MVDRKTPPPFVHSTTYHLIEPTKRALSDHIDLYQVNGGSQEVIKIECIYRAGRWFENTLGAAYFCGHLISKGTRTKSSFEIAQIFDRYGAQIEIQPGQDFISISIYGVTKYLEPVLDLLVEILNEPAYAEKEIDQSKSIFTQNLKVNEEKTSYLAAKHFRRNLFGETNPYGLELEEPTVAKIDRSIIVDHYKNFLNSLTVFVSGKISAQSEALINSKLKSVKTGTTVSKANTIADTKKFQLHVEKEGSVQCSIRTGKKSLMRGQKDYAEAIFVTHILGGYFGSRLMKNIREEKGLTYGIYAAIHPLQKDSYFVIGADVNKENLNLTMDEIRKELKILRTEKISADELHTAKNHFIGSLQSEITTPFAHADKNKSIVLGNLPQDFYHQMILTIDSITPEKIMEISEVHFHEDALSTVSVG